MTRQAGRDPIGTAVALVLGTLVGIALAAPALPEGMTVRIGESTFGTVGTALFAGALAVLILPLGIIVLYQVFALFDR